MSSSRKKRLWLPLGIKVYDFIYEKSIRLPLENNVYDFKGKKRKKFDFLCEQMFMPSSRKKVYDLI